MNLLKIVDNIFLILHKLIGYVFLPHSDFWRKCNCPCSLIGDWNNCTRKDIRKFKRFVYLK